MLQSSDVMVACAGIPYTFRLNRSGRDRPQAVLWLHGSGPGVNALSNWAQMLELLEPDFDNIAPDVIGFGDSTHPDPPPVGRKAFAELRVQTLLALLDSLGLARVHVIGNSMGGSIALALACAAPQRIGRMVLMGSGGAPLAPTPMLKRLVGFYDDPTEQRMMELMQAFVHDPQAFGSDIARIARDRMPMALREDVRRSHLATFAPGPSLNFTPQLLASIGHRTLVIHGASDRIIPISASEYLANNLPTSRLKILEQAGH